MSTDILHSVVDALTGRSRNGQPVDDLLEISSYLLAVKVVYIGHCHDHKIGV